MRITEYVVSLGGEGGFACPLSLKREGEDMLCME